MTCIDDKGKKIKVVVVLGPTGSGKTELGLLLAGVFNGEVVSADSMQVYRYMDVGTAKPSHEQRKSIPHHLIDVVDPPCDYTAARFRVDAARAIDDIHSRHRNAFVVGGTGLYIRSLTNGIFEGPGRDLHLREKLLQEAGEEGKTVLHKRLKEVDPASASRIHPNNLIRIIRALEVYYISKRPISDFQSEHRFSERPFHTLKIGLTKLRTSLYRDIDERVERMIDSGLAEEARALLERGYSRDLKPMQGLGYKEIFEYIDGRLPLAEAVRLMKRNTRRYAKRQMTWFRKDESINWFSPDESGEIISKVRAFLN